MIMSRTIRSLRCFIDDQRGVVSAETLIILPVVMWAFLATFVYFDVFAAQTTSQRSAYTISDSIGRQQNEVLTPETIDGYNRVFAYLASSRRATATRVTSIIWHPGEEEYQIVWSYGTTGFSPMTDADLTPELVARLPVLPERESVYLVETAMAYRPVITNLPFVGRVLDDRTLREFIVSRPRFSPQLRFNDGTGVVGTAFPTCDDPGVICGTQNPTGL